MIPQGKNNEEVIGVLLTLARSIIAQENRDVGPRCHDIESTTASGLREFVRMNPLIFHGSNVREDLQALLDEVYKIVHAMGVSYR